MFGKRSPPNPGAEKPDTSVERRAAEALERARAEKLNSTPGTVGAASSDTPKPPRGYTAPSSRRTPPGLPGANPMENGRKLVVGRDISLSGEIKACEQLIVEGQVSANLKDCKVLRISTSGLYDGAAEVDQAEISGRFEGDLTVKGTLILHATGRVSGRLRYGDMEIERGGKVNGTLEEIPAPSKAADPAAEDRPKATAKTPSANSVTKAKDLLARAAASESTTA